MTGQAPARRRSPWWPGPVLGPAAVLVEVVLLSWFEDRGEVGHWVTHLLVAATVALLALTYWVRRWPESAPHPVLAVVVADVLAAVPDLLVSGGLRQGRWMDVFLGSVSAHYAPAGNITWAILSVAAAVAYLRAHPSLWSRRNARYASGRRRRPE